MPSGIGVRLASVATDPNDDAVDDDERSHGDVTIGPRHVGEPQALSHVSLVVSHPNPMVRDRGGRDKLPPFSTLGPNASLPPIALAAVALAAVALAAAAAAASAAREPSVRRRST